MAEEGEYSPLGTHPKYSPVDTYPLNTPKKGPGTRDIHGNVMGPEISIPPCGLTDASENITFCNLH